MFPDVDEPLHPLHHRITAAELREARVHTADTATGRHAVVDLTFADPAGPASGVFTVRIYHPHGLRILHGDPAEPRVAAVLDLRATAHADYEVEFRWHDPAGLLIHLYGQDAILLAEDEPT